VHERTDAYRREGGGLIVIDDGRACPCVLCGSGRFVVRFRASDYEYGLPGTFTVSQCLDCDMWQQVPRPPFETILGYYPERYTAFSDQRIQTVTRLKNWAINAPRIRAYRRLVPTTGRILDLGCGSGLLLSELRAAGFSAIVGIEANAQAAAAGRRQGLDIRTGSLESAVFLDSTFDLVIINHVLEHVPDPRGTLIEIGRVLSAGGLLIGEVPNLACLERMIFARYWAGYHLPRHISFFDGPHLRDMLGRCGFDKISLEGKMQPANWLVSTSNWLRDRHPLMAERDPFSENSFFWLAATTPIAWMANLLGSSPSLRFKAHKP
jgi:SAM-dependent methyltransferase